MLLEVVVGTVVFNEMPEEWLCIAREKSAAKNTSESV